MTPDVEPQNAPDLLRSLRDPPGGLPSVLVLSLVVLPVLAGCAGVQSALDPAGRDAARIASLWWWMAGGAALIWLVVIGTAVYAVRVEPGPHPERSTRRLVVGGGVVFPTLVLAGLLAYGLALLPGVLEPAPEDALRIEISGEQWWWRVRYVPPGQGETGVPVDAANEVRLPVGERTQLVLRSPDVIHSFWVPALGGKIDLIPGRETRLALEPTETGVFRGACAEYCGTAHALMAFDVVVMERPAFERWLEGQRAPAAGPRGREAARGGTLFLANGCGACHTVRGTPADGRVGPDLTHVGGRLTLGAGTLRTDRDGFLAWLAATERVKPGVHMPSFGVLPEADLRAIAAYLEGLR